MFAYNLMLVILASLSLAERFNILGSRYVPILCSMIFVIIFTSARGDVGQDTSNYLLMYLDMENYKEYLELGYYYTAKTFSDFGFSFNFFLLITSIFSVTLYYVAISKFIPRKYIILSFMIIFCDLYIYFNISGLRQGIALSICLFSSYFAYRGRYFPFIFLVVLATLYHKTAVLFLIVYPLLKLKINFSFKQLSFITLGCVFSFILSKFFLFGNESLSFMKGINMYLSEEYNTFSINTYIVGFLRRFYPIFLFFWFYKNIKNDQITKSIFNVYLFGFVFYAINYPIFQDITVRISSYFIVFESILVVRIFMSLSNSLNKSIVLLMIYFVVYYKIFTYSSLDAYKYTLFSVFL